MPTTPKAWNSLTTVNSHTAGVQRDVQTVQLGNGEYWVIWNEGDPNGPGEGTGYEVVGQRFNALGEPQGEAEQLNFDYNEGPQINASTVALPGSSDFLIAYQDGDDASNLPYLMIERKAHDGFPLGTLYIPPSHGGRFIRHPEMAVASATSGLLVYEDSDENGTTNIRAQRFNPEALETVGDSFYLTIESDDCRSPQVTALSNGTFAVVYTDEYNYSQFDLDVKGAIVKPDGTSTPFSVAGSAGFQGEHSISALANGGFVVTWTDGSGGDVKAAIYNGSGQVVGSSFTVAGGADAQNTSEVVGLPDGGFVVAWENDTKGEITLKCYTANGAPAGSAVIAVDGLSNFPLSLTAMADGRVLLGYDNGDAMAQIWDPRIAVGGAFYDPGQQIGTVGDDTFIAAIAADTVHGWDGDDVITNSFGTQDLISGGAGNDRIIFYATSASEHADGGEGEDTIAYSALAPSTVIDLAYGQAYAQFGSQYISGFENIDVAADVTASVFGNGDDGVNKISTGAGADMLNGRAGADIMAGRGGDDNYYVDNVGDVVLEAAGEGADSVSVKGSWALQAGSEVEYVSAHDHTSTIGVALIGNEFDSSIHGASGGDYIEGGAGQDILTGWKGDDDLWGGIGNDTLYGNEGADDLQGGVGNDMLHGGAGIDTMVGDVGDDVYYVDSKKDVVVEAAGEGFDYIYVGFSYSLTALPHVEGLVSIAAPGVGIKLVGNALENSLYAGTGNDILNGGAGKDSMFGGAGNDRYIVDDAKDYLVEKDEAAGGVDRVETALSYTLGTGFENLLLTGNAVVNGTGNAANNNIVGNSQGNLIDGGLGADLLEGKDGNDRYVIDNIGDKILESATGGTADVADAWISYSIAGQYVETLRLMGSDDINATGNNQVNVLLGNGGDNVIKAAGGDDKLYGGDGNDTLTGGSGADRFIFDTALGAMNVDKILDFTAADDALYLDRDVFMAVANGALNASVFTVGAAAKDANDRIVYDKANGDLYYDADGTGAGAAILFATVADNTILTSADFIGF